MLAMYFIVKCKYFLLILYIVLKNNLHIFSSIGPSPTGLYLIQALFTILIVELSKATKPIKFLPISELLILLQQHQLCRELLRSKRKNSLLFVADKIILIKHLNGNAPYSGYILFISNLSYVCKVKVTPITSVIAQLSNGSV